MNLYDIDNAILSCIDENGEVIDVDKLQELQLAKEQKIENIALWYKNLCADVEAYKAEKAAFAEKERLAKNKAESLKKYLDEFLQGEKYKSTRVNISYRKSEAVVIDDIYAVNEDFLRYAEPTADKAAIKNAIKAGQTVAGVHIESKNNISIK